jgi:heterodisulfide reductase subunit C
MGPDFHRPVRLDEVDDGLRKEILENCGIDVEMCLECGKCSGGCSNGHIFDYTPRKIVQLVKYNAADTLMNMDALWACLACHLCVDRCPSGIDTPKIIDYMRTRAYRREQTATRPHVKLFYELMLHSVRKKGRISELPLGLKFNWRTGQYAKDANLAMKMFFKGKLSLLSPGVRKRNEIRRIFRSSQVREGGGNQ